MAGLPSFQLDALWPGVSDVALVSFLLYLLVFDFVGYWLHRAQHGLGLVVGAALAAPQPAPDDDVERQPQSPARRRS